MGWDIEMNEWRRITAAEKSERELGTEVSRTFMVQRDRHLQMIGSRNSMKEKI
jgi:hypothetical protein